MSKKHNRKFKTEGLEWLQHSLNAFNGCGFADRDSAEAFMDSYIDYKKWKKEPGAASLAQQYYNAVLPLAQHLVEDSEGPGQIPNFKRYESFKLSRQTKLV